jgi:hypothetical protein
VLTKVQLDRLQELVVERLSQGDFESPQVRENEPQFTARVLAPALKGIVGQVAVPGLHVSGDGAAPIRTVSFLGSFFRPDLGISRYGEWLFALEVKYLKRGQRQGSIATAIGQSLVYRGCGFPRVVIFVVDFCSGAVVLDEASLALAESLHLIVRRPMPAGKLGTDVVRCP